MKILFAGDFCQNDRLYHLFKEGKFDACFKGVKSVFELYDYRVVNLETPIIETTREQIPYKINLRADSTILSALKYLNVSCCTLANNHMMDYLDAGLRNTLNLLNKEKIEFVGAGVIEEEKRSVKYVTMKGKTIALINCCEHEFSITQPNKPGCNPLSIIDICNDIVEAKKRSDYVSVVIHGGHEYYNLPSPLMKKTYRFFIDSGADLIINHHQHCYSGYEKYNGKYIFYGIGNFCFDWPARRHSSWNYGYLVGIDFDDDISFQIYPFIQMDDEPGIVLLKGQELDLFDKQIRLLNAKIKDDDILKREFDSHCEKLEKGVKVNFSPYENRYLVGLSARGYLPLCDKPKRSLRLLNFIECEAHREVVINILKKYENF